MYLIINSRQLE